MSDHKTALVPIATSESSSPALFEQGILADTGLFAEALIYYDSVNVYYENANKLGAFISRLIQQGLSYDELINLIDDGTIRFLTAFTAHPVCTRDVFTDKPRSDIITQFVTIQDEGLKDSTYFAHRVLDTSEVRRAFSGSLSNDSLTSSQSGIYERFCEAAHRNSTIFNADVIGSGIVKNAYEDFLNAERCKSIVSTILQNIYYARGLGELPDFSVSVREMDGSNYDAIARNLNSTVVVRHNDDESTQIYEVLIELPTVNLSDHDRIRRIFNTLPISVAGVADLFVRSAGEMKSDFYLPPTMGQIVGDKLFEIDELQIQSLTRQNIIDSIEHTAEFPDIYDLINRNQLDFETVLVLRKHGGRFRTWLQNTDIGPDWKIWSAYHNEIALESGFTRNVRKAIKMFGVLAGASAGAAAGVVTKRLTGDDAQALGAATFTSAIGKSLAETVANKTTAKLFDYGAELGRDWTPKCFGDWTKYKIQEVLSSNRK